MELAEYSHGKSIVRVAKVRRRQDDRAEFVEFVVYVQLEGATEASFLTGDNSMVIATDTVKNNCYIVAKENEMLTPEDYGLALGNHFLREYPFVTAVRIRVVEKPWTRIVYKGQQHNHGFQRGSEGERIAELRMQREEHAFTVAMKAGIEKLEVLKTTQSGWEKFYRDRYTTLPDTKDRILATAVTIQWTFPSISGVDFAAVKLILPNIHFLPASTLPVFQRNNIPFENDVFIPTDEPQGQIECTVTRPQPAKM